MARIEVPITVVDMAGNAVTGASVRVKDRATGADRPLFAGETGATTTPNPSITDAAGRVNAWVDTGRHMALISGTGITSYVEYFDAVAANLPLSSSALPTDPKHGDEFYYQAAAGVMWRLFYNGNSVSARKWEFVGGAQLRQKVTGLLSHTTNATPSTRSSITNSPTVVLPWVGDYEIEWHATGKATAIAVNDWRIGALVGTTNVLNAIGAGASSYAANAQQTPGYKTSFDNTTAGQTARLQSFSTQASVALDLIELVIGITPIRVI